MPLYACAKLFTRVQSRCYACETTGFHPDVFFVTRRYFFPYDRFTGYKKSNQNQYGRALPFAFALTCYKIYFLYSTLSDFDLFRWRVQLSDGVCRLRARVQLKSLSSLLKNLRKEKGRYEKTLAKIQATATFLKKDMRRNVFPKFIEICMGTPCWCTSRWAPTWRPETSRNICHWILLQSVNLPLEELKNITIILYSNTRIVQIAEFPEISHFLNQDHSSLARHVNSTSRKSLEIQA